MILVERSAWIDHLRTGEPLRNHRENRQLLGQFPEASIAVE